MSRIFSPKTKFSASFIQRASADVTSLGFNATSCREQFLLMLANWCDTDHRAYQASKLPLHLFEVNTENLPDKEAVRVEEEHAERFRNVYRNLFGDRASDARTTVRIEVKAEWCLFISIFALVYPIRASKWGVPDAAEAERRMTHRVLKAHGRRSYSHRSLKRQSPNCSDWPQDRRRQMS